MGRGRAEQCRRPLRGARAAASRRRARARRARASSLRAGRARGRDALVRRFTRTFGDLDLPDPTRSGGPLLIEGEPGTGRLLFARVVHALAEPPAAFVHVVCDAALALDAIANRLAALGGRSATICLERPEQLSAATQRELAGWIDLGPPEPAFDPGQLRWLAIVDETQRMRLDGDLQQALASTSVRIPPLRERRGVAERFAEAWVADWSRARGQAGRTLSPDALAAIAADAWPGNLRELEGVLRGAVAGDARGAITAEELGGGALPDLPKPTPLPRATTPAANPFQPQAETETEGAPAVPGPEAPTPAPVAAPERDESGASVPALARALQHELRNPMTSLRTFAALLPERHDDESFRDEFRHQVERDLERMEDRLERLRSNGSLRPMREIRPSSRWPRRRGDGRPQAMRRDCRPQPHGGSRVRPRQRRATRSDRGPERWR